MSAQDTIRVDLHSHTRYSRDSILRPKDLVRGAREAGLGCIAVTDHNTINGGLAVREMADGFRVIVGEEVRTAEGEVLGLFLTEEIPGGLSAEETISRIKHQGGLVGLPHPYDSMRFGLDEQAREALISQVDFVEALNSRIVFGVHNKHAEEFARRHDLPMSAASDAHSPREVGRSYVEMRPFDGPEEFLKSLRSGRLVGRLSSPLIHLISRYAMLRNSVRRMSP
jgi:predicted metal-dependent phosphoesterase TrpH